MYFVFWVIKSLAVNERTVLRARDFFGPPLFTGPYWPTQPCPALPGTMTHFVCIHVFVCSWTVDTSSIHEYLSAEKIKWRNAYDLPSAILNRIDVEFCKFLFYTCCTDAAWALFKCALTNFLIPTDHQIPKIPITTRNCKIISKMNNEMSFFENSPRHSNHSQRWCDLSTSQKGSKNVNPNSSLQAVSHWSKVANRWLAPVRHSHSIP